MAFQVVANGNWQRSLPGANAAQGAGAAMGLVSGSNYDGGIGTIAHTLTHDWRMDRQNPPVGMVNLQIQRNGAQNPSSVACALVPDNLLVGALNHPDPTISGRAQNRDAELSRAIRNALTQSMQSRRLVPGLPANQNQWEIQIFRVQGAFSI